MKYIFPSYRVKNYSIVKKNGTWLSALFGDMLTIPGTLLAARFKSIVTPNGLSGSSFVIFFISVALMFSHPDKNVYYTLGFFISYLVDAIDGKLARLRGEQSKMGAIVDAFFDMFNHSIGLALVGLALSLRSENIFPLIIIFPFCIYMTFIHINDITKHVTATAAHEVAGDNNKTKWQLFCDARGLSYVPYNAVEIIHVSILLVGINLADPSMFLLIAIYLPFLPMIFKRIKKTITNN